MTEQELRALVREAVARQLATTAGPHAAGAYPTPQTPQGAAPGVQPAPYGPRASAAQTTSPTPAPLRAPLAPASVTAHTSHARFVIDRHLADRSGGADEAEGRCVIEPAVACTHCGFCLSYGH